MNGRKRLALGCLLTLALLLTTQCGGGTTTTTGTSGPAATTAATPGAAAVTAAPSEATAPAVATEAATAGGVSGAATTGATEAATTGAVETATAGAMLETATSEAAMTGATISPASVPQLNWKGTITMYAQAYTPNATDAKDPKNVLKAFREVADQYEKLHPGIKIQFNPEAEIQDYDSVIRAKAAAGELWDVWWGQWASLNGTYPEGIAVDLTPYFKQPNPYISGNKAWQDAMNQTVLNETISPKGAHYNINGDFVGTAFFYNQELFGKAGIASPPKSWPELIDAAKKLKAAGIAAAGATPSYGWFQRHFLTDFYANDFEKIAAFDKAPAISALDEAVAIRKGILSPKDPRFMAWWPIFKQFTDYWEPDYLTVVGDQPGNPALDDFVAGKTAIYYSGSWTPNDLRDRGVTFKWAAFNFPTLSKDVSQYSNGKPTAGQVGGPNAAYQWAVSTPKSDKSMSEAGKTEAVLDWLRFIGTPQAVEQIVNEKGSFIPTWPGTKAKPGTEQIAEQAREGLNSVWVGNSSAKLDEQMQRIFGQYLAGQLDIKAASDQVQQAVDAAAADYAKTNKVNLDDYK